MSRPPPTNPIPLRARFARPRSRPQAFPRLSPPKATPPCHFPHNLLFLHNFGTSGTKYPDRIYLNSPAPRRKITP